MYRVDAEERSLFRRLVDFPLVTMVIAWVAVMAPAGLIAGLFERALGSSPTVVIAGKLAVVGVILASYKLIVRHLGERKHDDLAGPGSIRQLGAGLAGGVLLFALIVGVAAIAGVYRIAGPGDTHQLLGSIISDGIFPAVAEEVLFRAILFRWIEEFGGSWVALVVSSALFGLSHVDNPGAGLVSTAGIMLEGGLLLGAAYMLTRRLWLPVGIHAAWNLTQGEVFDIPVSGNDQDGLLQAQLRGPELLTGGGFGLEASLIGITVGTLAGLLLLLLAVRRGQLMAPRWARRRP
jgi:uncharacterized protein